MSDRDDRHLEDAEDTAVRLLRLAGRRSDVDAERTARVRAAVEARWRARTATQTSVVPFPARALRLAAAAAVVAGVVALLWSLQDVMRRGSRVAVARTELVTGEAWLTDRSGRRSELAEGDEITDGARLETGAEGRAAIRLPGERSLRIDHGTRLGIVDEWELQLEAGAVYVASDDAGTPPVTIHAGGTDVVEIGTQFEVRLLPGRTRVRVRDGLVAVTDGADRHEVPAGREATVHADGRVEVTDVPIRGEVWQWVANATPAFSLEDRTAADLLRWVERESHLEIRFDDPGLAAVAAGSRLHGALPALPPSRAAAVVLPSCGLEARVEDGVLVVSGPRRAGRP